MTRFHVFAARDGDTYAAHFEATDAEAAKAKARPFIAASFGLDAPICPEEFDGELDGFTAEAGELEPFTPDELMEIGWAVQWAGHFATGHGDCRAGGPSFSSIAKATRLLESRGAKIYHSRATRETIDETHRLREQLAGDREAAAS